MVVVVMVVLTVVLAVDFMVVVPREKSLKNDDDKH